MFRFNFSEAAVVINGTTNVYCRKVEYVYQLASDYFEALSAINEKKNRRGIILLFVEGTIFYM